MPRSYGSNSTLCALKESTYGTKPTGNWEKFSFISADLSAEQTLISSELLGQGREPGVPFRDVIKDEGSVVVPVDTRDFGRWLQFLLGDPVSSAVAAQESKSKNTVASRATLSGGGYIHSFSSGATTLPSFSLEIGHSNIPAFFVHTGCMLNSMSLSFQRSGSANATLNIIAQGENRHKVTQGGTATSRAYKPFSQFNGKILRNGEPLANIVSAEFTYSNNMESIQTIRSDGLIEGVDPAAITITGNIETRFGDTMLLEDAIRNNAVELELGYQLFGDFSLFFKFHKVYLPRPRIPISGPGGVQATFNWQGALSNKLLKSVTVELKNDVESYNHKT